nr:MAG TPA_asm: minor tail protein [Caudoviricetes sp.]
MASRIKGITIEIGGDTTKLEKALHDVDHRLIETKKDLKDVERLLKLDPKNTELLAQKQRLLADNVEQSTKRLEKLHEAAEGMNEAFANGQKREKLTKDLDKAKQAATEMGDKLLAAQKNLDRLQSSKRKKSAGQIEEAREEVERLAEAVDDADANVRGLQKQLDSLKGPTVTQEQFDRYQREVLETEQALKDAQKAQKDFNSGLDEFKRKAEALGTGAGKVKSALSPVTKTITALGAAAIAAVPATEELRSDLSKLDNNARNAGVGVDAAREAFRAFVVVSDETDSAVEAVANLLQGDFTESNLQKAVENLAGAYLSFPDTIKIESLADSLQETLATGKATGQFGELLDRLGIGAQNFSAGLANCTTEAQKQDYALSTLAHSGMADVYKSWQDNNKELAANKEASLDLKLSLAELAEDVQPLVTQMTELARDFLAWFNSLDDGAKKTIIAVAGLVAAIGPVAGVVEGVSKVLPKVIELFNKLDIKMGLVGIAAGVIVGLAVKLAAAWDDMTGAEKVVAVLGLVAAAALTAAIAMGAFQSALTMGLAAAGIVAGIVAVTAAINTATSRAKKAAQNATPVQNAFPAYASGGVIPPNDPYLAVVGDNKTEREIIAPESTLRKLYREEHSGAAAARPANLNATIEMDGVTFARVLVPYVDSENARRGVSIVER